MFNVCGADSLGFLSSFVVIEGDDAMDGVLLVDI
jgi:hypothetical protein